MAARVRAGNYLAANCSTCHTGRAQPGRSMPSLRGLPKAYFIEQMKGFRESTRQATLMHQIAKGYSEAQIELLAEHFAASK